MPDAPFNTLFYGDNLDLLRDRDYFPTACVDVIYLDPPFNSARSYNVLFKDESGRDSDAQITAFDDTWHWGETAERTYSEIIEDAPERVSAAIGALRQMIGENQMLAYLVMMTARLIELHRVLKPTGSLYLHCDPTASHYLKIVLDTIFGPENFRNEIVWRRTGAHGHMKRFAPVHDTIFYFTKTSDFTWNKPKVPYMLGHVEENFVQDEHGYRTDYYGNVLTGSGIRGGESGKAWRGFDPTSKGRHWAIPGAIVEDSGEDMSELTQHQKLDRLLELGYITIEPGAVWPVYERRISETDGSSMTDIWAYQPYTQGLVFGTNLGIDEDVRWIHPKAAERLNYPTQKPLALLERIISASSNPGDVVLDPFCGCGTAIAAAQKLGRRWIGIDITHLSIALMKYRLADMFDLKEKTDYRVIGEPADLDGARALAAKEGGDRYQFQWWALSLVRAKPLGGDGGKQGKKGSDKGIDGVISFTEGGTGRVQRALVQVKSGHVKSGDIRDLKGTLDREQAAMGLFITLEKPSKDMITEATTAGFYKSPGWHMDYPRLQILTIEDLLHGKGPLIPGSQQTFKQAAKHTANDGPEQLGMEME